MPTASKDSPASLYGPVSLVLGIIALAAIAIGAFAGIAIPLLAGSLASTFAILGLVNRNNRPACLIGLIGGAVGLLYPVLVMSALTYA